MPTTSCARVPATAAQTASGRGITQPAWCSHSLPAGSDTESLVQTGCAQYTGPEALWAKWLPTVSSPLPETQGRQHPRSKSTSASPMSIHRTCSRSQCLNAQAYPCTIRPSTSSRTASLRHAARHPAHVLNNASRSAHSSHPASAPAIFCFPSATASVCRGMPGALISHTYIYLNILIIISHAHISHHPTHIDISHHPTPPLLYSHAPSPATRSRARSLRWLRLRIFRWWRW